MADRPAANKPPSTPVIKYTGSSRSVGPYVQRGSSVWGRTKKTEKRGSVSAKSFKPLLLGPCTSPAASPSSVKGPDSARLNEKLRKNKERKEKRKEGEAPAWTVGSGAADSVVPTARRGWRFPPSITREPFAVGTKRTPRSRRIHGPEVSWNLLSLLPRNKTTLTSVRFAVK